MPEETEVRRGGGADAPVEFGWNGRTYRVEAVLTHHRIRTFPTAPPPGAVRPELPRPAESEEEIVDELSARRAARSGSPEAAVEAESGAEQQPREPFWHDQEVWRVRANPAGVPPGTLIPGVFDLRFDWAVGRWTVTRIDTLEEQR